MMIPVVALVGRPNVGKSTLFNRLTRSRDALVADYAGLTRDRKYGEAVIDDRRFMLIDTGGISGDEAGIDAEMANQSWQAVDEADIVLFIVDARQGLTAADEMIAVELRQRGRPFHLIANKIDGINEEVALADFYALGVNDIEGISASHGRGVRQMIERVFGDLPAPEVDEQASAEQEPDNNIRIGIIGRPNVGKSTLVNRLLGEDRVVVYDHPGTTRDSIYIDYERDGQPYTIIDTAGVRRRKNVKESVEKFSIVKTLKAIDDANVIILVMDAQEGIVDQDLHLLGQAMQAGRALVIALNKWDGLDGDKKAMITAELDRRMRFIDYAEIHRISALHGTGVGNLYQSINKAFRSATQKLQTTRLTQILQDAIADHAPPMVNGRRIKLRYAHAGGSNPPIVVIHGNQVERVPDHYKRYLEKVYRKALKLHGTPIKIELRGGENPYANKGKRLSERQTNTRKRIQQRKNAAPSTRSTRGRKPGA
jgi:GTP-binding protein